MRTSFVSGLVASKQILIRTLLTAPLAPILSHHPTPHITLTCPPPPQFAMHLPTLALLTTATLSLLNPVSGQQASILSSKLAEIDACFAIGDCVDCPDENADDPACASTDRWQQLDCMHIEEDGEEVRSERGRKGGLVMIQHTVTRALMLEFIMRPGRTSSCLLRSRALRLANCSHHSAPTPLLTPPPLFLPNPQHSQDATSFTKTSYTMYSSCSYTATDLYWSTVRFQLFALVLGGGSLYKAAKLGR